MHDPGGDGSRLMIGNHNQDRHTRAVRSEPSDTGLSCPTRCLAAHTVPSERARTRQRIVRCMDQSTRARSDSSGRLRFTSSVGREASCSRDGRKGVYVGISKLTGEQ